MKTVENTATNADVLFGKLVTQFHGAVDSIALDSNKMSEMMSILTDFNPRFSPRRRRC